MKTILVILMIISVSARASEDLEKRGIPVNNYPPGRNDAYAPEKWSGSTEAPNSPPPEVLLPPKQGPSPFHHQQTQVTYLPPTPLITKVIKVPVPEPTPVTQAVKIPVPYEVKRPVPLPVHHSFPVYITKPYPVQIDRPLPVYLSKPLPVPISEPSPLGHHHFGGHYPTGNYGRGQQFEIHGQQGHFNQDYANSFAQGFATQSNGYVYEIPSKFWSD